MEIQEALQIVRKLADGIHPETGEVLQTDCLYQQPQVVRALHRAAGALEFQDEQERAKKFLPANAGKSWSNQEDAQICDELRRGINFQEIAKTHNRTIGSIIARLVRLRKISARPAGPQDRLSAAMIQKRMRAVALAWVAATAGSALLTGQQAGSPAAIQHRQHIVAREKWQMSGRQIPGMNSAGLQNRAIQQKIQMRSARVMNPAAVGLGGSWVSLGPRPLPSDASGIGLQDYGWVSGRATAVAIDPNDASGNTVYAGGAYAGVWKSTNAGALSPNPSAVNWTPLTDNQATLAIGAIAIQPQLSNPDPTKSVVLAGTGETNSSEDSYHGFGILRSQVAFTAPRDSR